MNRRERHIDEFKTRINRNGRVVIPAAYREALGWRPGDEVVLRLENEELRLSSVRQALARARRLIREHVPEGQSLSESLIEDRRAEASHE